MAAKVPMPVAGVDVYALPLSTMEGFVLSRVDGAAALEDISMMTGLPVRDVGSILDRLHTLGAVTLPWRGPVPHADPSPGAKPAPAKAAAGGATDPAAIYDDPDSPPDYELSELDAPAAIDLPTRRRVLNAYYSVADRNLYEVLGVAFDADKATIRTAYFALSKRFHPDAFFGQSLGPYGPKLEAVFKRLTEAYETLGRKKRRAEYDAYLASTEATLQVTASIAQAEAQADRLRSESVVPHPSPNPVPRISEVPPAPDSGPAPAQRGTQAAGTPGARGGGGNASEVPAEPARTVVRPPRRAIDRRRLAADRLRRHLPSLPTSRPPAPRTRGSAQPEPSSGSALRASSPGSAQPTEMTASSPPASRRPTERPPSDRARGVEAVDDLKRALRAQRASQAPAARRAEDYLRDAQEAEERGDMLSAANTLCLGLALAPDHVETKQAYERVSKAVARSLADNYENQARYEQRAGNWAQAAKSWARVCEGRPEAAEPAQKAALCLLRASGDLHAARKYAETAVAAEPDDSEHRVILAEVLLAAGLKINARRELEKAVKLNPKDEVAKSLLRESNRG